MERELSLERLFKLGEFKLLTVTDNFSGIPEELAMNTEFMSDLRRLQLISADKAYYDYSVMAAELQEVEGDVAKAELLATVQLDLYTKLVGHMTQSDGE